MKKLQKNHYIFIAMLFILLTNPLNANATLMNFDDQGLVGPSYISGPPYDSPEVVNVNDFSLSGDVVFENGRIFSNASGMYANNTSIYATIDYGNYTSNIIRIVFPNFVTSYNFDIINGIPRDIEYQVRDNSGNSQNYTIIPNSINSYETVGAASVSINQIEIEALTNAEDLGYSLSWLFAIDNFSFDTTTTIPEPASLLLVGSGLLGLLVLRRSR